MNFIFLVSKMCFIFILGPDLLKRGMTAKMGIGNPDPDPVGDQGIERIPDPVPDRAVLWKMETKKTIFNYFLKEKTTTNKNNKIITSEFWLRDEKKRTALFSFVLHTTFHFCPHTKQELLLKSISNNKSPNLKP